MAVREAIPKAPEAETEQEVSSFAKSLFLGEIHEELRLPLAEARSRRAGPDPRPQRQAARVLRRELRPAAGRGGALGPRRDRCATSARSALSASTSTRSTAARASRRPATRASSRRSARSTRRSRSCSACTSRSASRGSRCSAPTSRRSAGCPTSPSGRKLAAFALTEPEAGSDAYSVQSRAVQQPDGSWVLNGEKRYIGNGSRADVITTFARAEVGRQGQAHRADAREGHGGLRGRRALRHDGPARQRPAPPLLQGRPRPGRERARRARRGLPGRDADPQQRAHRARHRLGRRRQEAARPHDRPRQGAAAVRPAAGRLRAGPGQDRLDGLLPLRAGVDVLPDLRAGRPRRPRLLARVGDLQGLGDRVPLVRGQPLAAARGRRGLHARRALREDLRDIRIFPIFEGANDVLRAFIALGGFKPVGEKLEGLGDIGLSDPIGSIGVLVDYVADRASREVRPDRITHGPRGADSARRRGLRAGQAARATSPRSCCASTARRSSQRQFQQKRLADGVADIFAQIAVLSRVSRDLRGPGRRALGPGALHRRHLLHPRRHRVRLQLRPDRVATTTSA